jgi:hypothetical protein
MKYTTQISMRRLDRFSIGRVSDRAWFFNFQ